MFKDCVAVVDIQTSHIDVVIGKRGVNNTFVFKARESVEYYTFYDGAFYDVKVLEEKLSTLFVSLLEKNEISKISTVYVGVAGEFFKLYTTNYRIAFNKVKKISVQDVKTLFSMGFEGVDDCGYTLINRTAVYYAIDGVKTDSPLNKRGGSISARLTYNMVSNTFKDVIDGIMHRIGVKTVRYLPIDYCMATYLFSKEERDNCKVLIDVGNVSTSISIVCQNALLYSSAFALGGGLITAYLMDKFDCDYDVAETLKRKLNLGLRDNTLSKYVVEGDKFDRHVANSIAKDVLDKISEKCDEELSKCTLKIPSDVETVFTGGGICFLRGAVEYMSTRLGVFSRTVMPKLPHYNNPTCSSLISLLATALDTASDRIFYY